MHTPVDTAPGLGDWATKQLRELSRRLCALGYGPDELEALEHADPFMWDAYTQMSARLTPPEDAGGCSRFLGVKAQIIHMLTTPIERVLITADPASILWCGPTLERCRTKIRGRIGIAHHQKTLVGSVSLDDCWGRTWHLSDAYVFPVPIKPSGLRNQGHGWACLDRGQS